MLKKGTYFKISGVPSMIIEKKDNNVELFQGPKVLQLLNQMVQSIYVPEGDTEDRNAYYPEPTPQTPPQTPQLPQGVPPQPLPSEPSPDLLDGPPELGSDPSALGADYDVLDDLLGEDLSGTPASAPSSYVPQRKNIKDERAAELKNIAKQMEMERKRVLGIKDQY